MSHPPPSGPPGDEPPPSPYEPPADQSPYAPPPAGQQPYATQPDQPAYELPAERSPYGPPGDQPSYGDQRPQQSAHWSQQPPYPPQGPYGQYGPPPSGPGRRTNVLAILSLVFAFVFPPAGAVLGHVAKRQIRTSGEDGDQLATWGLILGYVFTVLTVLACCGWLALVAFANNGDSGRY
ncbi:DUF4190 domain-containing protein [Micromonospora sp. NBRC 107095]|uniref:DUF4190 domain-containing protein n=1 Tax=Micromonospora sp. NBRC 107095 TaxID=3032209 RepID=UPI0024A23943|nr:DUF4190 domain-containing protein [Micromonospora sp. NBRC 107095]GLZ57263.1 hypothetical protein Misp05_08390 [Micromonospora sp. NBRC 107095]